MRRTPNLVPGDKRTGKVVWERSDPGEDVLHGQWSSPALGVIGGVRQIVTAAAEGATAALSSLRVLGKAYPF